MEQTINAIRCWCASRDSKHLSANVIEGVDLASTTWHFIYDRVVQAVFDVAHHWSWLISR
jgi:hypothetical protein